jgi:hypothetical protein
MFTRLENNVFIQGVVMKRLILFAGIAILFMFSVAQADIIYDTDPSILHIGNPPNSGTYLFGNEVRPIGDINLSILMNGQDTLLNNPLLLILGVPNSTSLTPGISSLSAGTLVGLTFGGSLTSGDAYGFLGLGGNTNNSNSFTNWHNADLAVNGIDATSFGLFVYALNDTGLAANNNPIDVTFLSSLPVGTFAIAYGQTEELKHNGDIKVTPYSTPFTEAGLTTNVPEPNTMVLLGTGLLGLALYGRRKFRK